MLTVIGLVGLGGLYLLMTRKASAATPPAATGPASITNLPLPGGGSIPVSPPPSLPAAIAPVGTAISAAQAIWQNLPVTTGPQSGFVNFNLSGGGVTSAAAALLPWATDTANNLYTQWSGLIYIVKPDGLGNYTANLLGS